METENSRSISKSTLSRKVQNLLWSEKICGLCLECGDMVSINDELEIVSDGRSHLLRLGVVYSSVFYESTEELASDTICNNCTDQLIQTYKFIQNSQFTAKLLISYVNDLISKTRDLVTCLKDTELESNIVIVLENKEVRSSGNEIARTNISVKKPNEDKMNETQKKTQCKLCLKEFINPQNLISHYKNHLKTKCNICDLILPEGEVKNHLRVHEDVFQCNSCSEVFYALSDLQKHSETTHDPKTERLQCVMCLKSIEISQDHDCTFECPECNDPSCVHFTYLIHYRDQALKQSEAKCLDCDYLCRTKEDLIAHVNICHLDQSYTCHTCGQNFCTKDILQNHISFNHGIFTCEFCNLNLNDRESLEKHTYFCKDVKRQYCEKRPANFATAEGLQIHEGIKHEMIFCNEKFIDKKIKYKMPNIQKQAGTCNICKENFETEEELTHHMKKHAKFYCNICNIEYDSLRKLSAHNRKHIGPFSKCYVCGKDVRDALLEKHIESHGIVTCNKCEKTFLNISLLKYHQKSHLDDVQCPKCNLMVNPAKLKTHLENHAMDEDPQLKEIKKQKPNIQCELCDYITWNSILLECHMNRYHLKLKPYVCHICSKNFFGKHLLKKHIKSHTVDHVICTFCGKKLANSSCLKSHLKLHTGEKNYPCEVCGEKFRSSSIMNVHRIKKHSEREAACPLCSSKFFNLVELRRHVIKIHWKKDTKFDPRELKGLENHYHLFHDGRRIRMDDQDIDFYMPCR